MTDSPKRRFWSFHLAAAVALMITASILTGLLTRQSEFDPLAGDPIYNDGVFTIGERGWPFVYDSQYFFRHEPNPGMAAATFSFSDHKRQVSYEFGYKPDRLACDIGIAILICIGVFCATEYLARRRRKS